MTKTRKSVVYTAIVGDYDYLRPVPKGLTGIDFICFTDGSVSEKHCERKGWFLRKLPQGAGSSRKGCRQLKSMPQKYLSEYEVSIWLDSNVSFNGTISELVDNFKSSEALVRGFHHPVRACAYLEAEECITQRKDSEVNLNSMIRQMRLSGFPANYGLTETNVLFRKHNNRYIKKLDEDWNYFLNELTIRDQISFDYLCCKHGIDVWYFEGSTHRNEHPVFSRGLHRSENKLKDAFAYAESFQGVYPSLRRVINFFYSMRSNA